MKKFLTILLVLFCFTASAAASDTHTEIRCLIPGSSEFSTADIDFYQQNQNTVMVSSLFPDLAVYLDREIPDIDVLFCLNPDVGNHAVSVLGQIKDNWLKKQKTESTEGIFIGDLFDSAFTETTASFRLKDFSSYLKSALSDLPEEDALTGPAVIQFLESTLSELQNAAGNEEIMITVKQYEQGQYETILFSYQNDVLLTVSADHSGGNREKYLISYRNEEEYCFRETEYTTAQGQLNISSAFWISNDSAFRNNSTNRPIYSESVMLITEDENNCWFQYILKSATISDSLTIIGKITDEKDGASQIRAELSVQGSEQEILQFYACRNSLNRNVRFTDKKEMHLSDPQARTETDAALFDGLTSLAVEVIPLLPQIYQEILISLIVDLTL